MKVDIAENFPSVSLKARQIYICSAGWVTNSIAVLVLLDMRIARRSVPGSSKRYGGRWYT